MTISLRRHDDSATLAADMASALLTRIEEAQARGEVPNIGLTGGTIAVALHEELARRAADSAVDWSRVVFWWSDERWVPAGSPDRNEMQARDAFLDHVETQARPMPASDSGLSLSEAAEVYAEELREFGAGSFEVLVLGIGPDAHIASLFPGHPAADITDAIVVPVQDSPKPPPERLSLTFEAMERTRAVWFIAGGSGKAEAVASAVAITTQAEQAGTAPSRHDVRRVPAAGVLGEAETVWWLDEAAASALPPGT